MGRGRPAGGGGRRRAPRNKQEELHHAQDIPSSATIMKYPARSNCALRTPSRTPLRTPEDPVAALAAAPPARVALSGQLAEVFHVFGSTPTFLPLLSPC
jgi:hypothetical protein